MEDFIKWIIENKELVLLVCVTASISIPISIHFGKTVINNYKRNTTTNNYTNNYTNKNTAPSHNKDKTSRNLNTSKNMSTPKNIELSKIRLYSTGKKGKVYTTNFHKLMNHNFGIEITLLNPHSTSQNVKVGWCIYKNGTEIIKGTFHKKVAANKTLTTDFYVQEQTFRNMKPGEYKSQFWVNDKRVQKVHFTITNK